MSGKDRFDKYIRLLSSNPSDLRVRLFFHELMDQAEVARNRAGRTDFIATDIKLTVTNPSMQSRYFSAPDTPVAPGDQNDVHSEWVTFLCNTRGRLDRISARRGVDPEVLNIIHSLAGSKVGGSVEQFMQVLVTILFTNLDTLRPGPAPRNVINNNVEWINVDSYIYNTGPQVMVQLIDALALRLARPYSAPGAVGENLFNALVRCDPDDLRVVRPGEHQFGYKWDSFFINSLLEAHYKNKSIVAVGTPSAFFNTGMSGKPAVPSVPSYYRKDDGHLYTMKNNVETQVDIESQEFKNLTVANKCFTTGVNSHTDAAGVRLECRDYLTNCLRGKGINDCKKFLKSSKFWDTAKAEVNNTNPVIAVQTLDAFEIKKISSSSGLTEYESYTTWRDNLKKILPTPDYNAIKSNKELEHYLEALIEKVNNNPGILNPTYNVTSTAPKYTPKNKFSGYGLSGMVPVSRNQININRSQNMLQQHTIRLRRAFSMIGGDARSNQYYNERATTESNFTHTILANDFLELEKRLASHNKKISPADSAKIKSLFDQLKESEIELNKTILYTDKYLDLLEIHGQDDKHGVLTYDNLQKFVDAREKYLSRVNRKGDAIVEVLRAIAKAFSSGDVVA
jgi:hypothetical protein